MSPSPPLLSPWWLQLFQSSSMVYLQQTLPSLHSGPWIIQRVERSCDISFWLNNVTDGYLCIFMESCHIDAKFQAIKSLWPYCDDIKCATGHTIKLHASVLHHCALERSHTSRVADYMGSFISSVKGKCMRMRQFRCGLCFNVFLTSRTTTWAHKCWTICIWFAAIIWYLEQTEHTKPSRLKPHVHVNGQVHRIISAILLYWVLERTSALHPIRG